MNLVFRTEMIRILLILLLFLTPFLLSAQYQTHKVEKGDTIYNLSQKYNVTSAQIRELNGMAEGDNLIHIGQVLKIKETSFEKPAKPEPKPTPVAEQNPPKPAPEEKPRETDSQDTAKLELPDDYYYTVQKGEGIYRISVNHGVTQRELEIWNNLDINNYTIHAGDRLIIKDPSGFTGADKTVESPVPAVQDKVPAVADTVVVERIYVVQKGDTLFKISRENGISVDELKARNNLTSDSIQTGQRLWLVGTPPEKGSSQSSASSAGGIRSDLFMPTQGRVTSEFGMRKGRAHKGIDIANKSGTPIYAALDGVVVFSGVQRGYGNVVLIEHPDFVITVYAHNEKNLVKVNDKVKRGQHIANMGSTGNSTGPHLHFEYRVKGTAINPRKVLPF